MVLISAGSNLRVFSVLNSIGVNGRTDERQTCDPEELLESFFFISDDE